MSELKTMAKVDCSICDKECEMAPSQHVWEIPPVYIPKDKATKATYIDLFQLPFNTKIVELSALKKGDVLVQGQSWDNKPVLTLYKIVRINKKTVSVEDCDQRGLLTPNSRASKIEIHSWSEWKIIE